MGAIIPLNANLIATVLPPFVVSNGSWYHYLGGTLPINAYSNATVFP